MFFFAVAVPTKVGTAHCHPLKERKSSAAFEFIFSTLPIRGAATVPVDLSLSCFLQRERCCKTACCFTLSFWFASFLLKQVNKDIFF